jgi:hypothetical protein
MNEARVRRSRGTLSELIVFSSSLSWIFAFHRETQQLAKPRCVW